MKRFLTLCLLMICLLAMPVQAAEDKYVFDGADLLTPEQELALTELCAETAQSYNCGVYLVTLQAFGAYGTDAYDAAVNFYTQMGLGLGNGSESDGVLLLLSMAERDYSLICHGYYGNEVFDDSGLSALEEEFLPWLGEDLWYEGFEAYVTGCQQLMYRQEQEMSDYYGEDYVDYYNPGSLDMPDRLRYAADYLIIVVPVACLFALVVCIIMAFSMRTARQATGAGDYVVRGGVQLRVREDRYLHSTTQVIHHERNNSGSGGGGGGGFSGHSGKF